MGQPITVTVRAGARPEVRFFDANRSLTGMAIETYTAGAERRRVNGRPTCWPGASSTSVPSG